MTEGGARARRAYRIAALDGAIAEIEAVIVRPGLMGAFRPIPTDLTRLDGMGIELRWFAPILPEERMPRAELERIADAYFSAIERNDGRASIPSPTTAAARARLPHPAGEPDDARCRCAIPTRPTSRTSRRWG